MALFTEDGESFLGEDEHTLENFMLCSFAHFASSPFLHLLHEEEMCKASRCHFFRWTCCSSVRTERFVSGFF